MKEFVKRDCFTQDWIKTKKEELSGDPTLIEKCIHAFALLGYLAQSEIDFVFKGGTSLLLHAQKIKRLSIDIDIIYGGDKDELKEKLIRISQQYPFVKIAEDDRGDRGLPKRKHFKFFYSSTRSKGESYILLDIVLDSPNYIPFIETKLIKGLFFETEHDFFVNVPTIEGLLGDKLTAFAPHTIGVPFGDGFNMQVVKQLFDIDQLFNISYDFPKISKSFEETATKEISYRTNKFTVEDVLQDIIKLCLGICSIRLKGFQSNSDTSNIEDGLSKMQNHLIQDKFRMDTEAKIAASKVFCVANTILKNRDFNFEKNRYSEDRNKEINSFQLPDPYGRLNRLKTVLPEAFYYLWQGICNNLD